VLPSCPFSRAFPYPQPGDAGGCCSAPACQLDLDEITAVLRTRRLRSAGTYSVPLRASTPSRDWGFQSPEIVRDRGRPRKTWSACVRNDMTIRNLDGVNPLDRNSWRMSVRCCLPRSPGQPQHRKYQNQIWWWWSPVWLASDHSYTVISCKLSALVGTCCRPCVYIVKVNLVYGAVFLFA